MRISRVVYSRGYGAMGVKTVDGKEFGCHSPKQVSYAVVRSHTCRYCVLPHVTVSPGRWYLGIIIVIIRHDTAGGGVHNVPQ